MTEEVVAAIDCGTNSTRLLISGSNGSPLERLQRITRLGAGVDSTGLLSDAGIERTIEVLSEYRQLMDVHQVARGRVVATSAARDAANVDIFLQRVAEVTRMSPEILSGQEEALLSFTGATADLDHDGDTYLVVDVGGGSTELVVGTSGDRSDGSNQIRAVSIDVGCVRITERYLHHDPPLSGEIEAAREEVRTLLPQPLQLVGRLEWPKQMVALAGTASTLAMLDRGLRTYDRELVHHWPLSLQRITELFDALATRSSLARRLDYAIPEGRDDVIVAGTLVLLELMKLFNFEECLVSESDILDGLVMSLLEQPGHEWTKKGSGLEQTEDDSK
ncbi:MAG: Ppx/GppA family phosphatase [Actinobacteria bacterium]|nr:Ppx/GppA family phosphatase [Actinomycetota bacterium]MCL6096037.1 Ppx/GppA family phosphatase [Actinomycetota bacterium]